jgi:hypothetical protein
MLHPPGLTTPIVMGWHGSRRFRPGQLEAKRSRLVHEVKWEERSDQERS